MCHRRQIIKAGSVSNSYTIRHIKETRDWSKHWELSQAAQPNQRGGEWHRLAHSGHHSFTSGVRCYWLSGIISCQGRGYRKQQSGPPTSTALLSHLHLPSFFLEPTLSKQSMTLSISNNLEDAQSEERWWRMLAAQVGLQWGSSDSITAFLSDSSHNCCLAVCPTLCLPGILTRQCSSHISCVWCNNTFLQLRNTKCYYKTNYK